MTGDGEPTAASATATPVPDAADAPAPSLRRVRAPASGFQLTRLFFLRFLGAIYFVAFLSLALQVRGLFGARGVLPVRLYLDNVTAPAGSRGAGFLQLPSLFWLGASDDSLILFAWAGVALSLFVIFGATNAILMFALWALYMSFVHVGQIFYGYGWEILLLETGFLAVFLCPLRRVRPLPDDAPPPAIVIYLLRWLIFRVMFGAGLIKLRGDDCWRDLTCLHHHYETQPLPSPTSWLLHQSPDWLHKIGVLWNHFVELIVPFGLFGPRRIAAWAGALTLLFQLNIAASGNLSFLNFLTITVALACFDDRTLARLLPARLARRAHLDYRRPILSARVAAWAVFAVVAVLSIDPISNLISRSQIMNTSFDRLHLVNTYGAFGAVGRVRHEVILEGTGAAAPDDDAAVWREYEFPCKPGDVRRRPCFIAPFQYRLDWQIWFAAMSTIEEEPWLVRLIHQLLKNEPRVRALLASDPFPDRPPKFIRATLYEYRFTRIGDRSDAWWTRKPIRVYLAPLSLTDPTLTEYLRSAALLD